MGLWVDNRRAYPLQVAFGNQCVKKTEHMYYTRTYLLHNLSPMKSYCRTPLLLSLVLSLLSFGTSFTPSISYDIDCGAKTSITLSNENPPRTFKADDSNLLLNGNNSFSLPNPNNSSIATGSLYSTARVSSSYFTYKFKMDTNTSNVLRLHFFPFSTQSYDLSTAKFGVHILNRSILLDNFTVSDTISPTIKEFFLWTDSTNMELEVSFIPQSNSLAFVSAIEAFTAPPEMLNGRFPISIGNNATIIGDSVKQTLETMYRVNMPGPLITPENDSLWRTWITDDPYLYGAVISQNRTMSARLNFNPPKGSSEEIAPETVYNTARVINTSIDQFNSNPDFNINITWSFSVHSGYQYLIRLHFCDILSLRKNPELVFTVYIMDYLAITNKLRPTDYTTYAMEPFYIDFIAHVMTARNITVSIGLDMKDSTINNASINFNSLNKKNNAFLNGLEIFKVLEILKVNNLNGTTNLSSGKNISLAVILGASISGVIVIISLLLSCVVIASIKKQHQKPTRDVKETQLMWSPMTRDVNSIDTSSKSCGATTIGASPRVDLGLLISLDQINMATNNFDENNLIGIGGFGKVYKGVLSNGIEVAVKRASARSQQGIREFQTEIEVLSQIRHRQLVLLIGYCNEHSEMILVYEYMEKGPLRNYLYGNHELPSLSWKQRLDICIKAAKGLHYLHTGYSQTIIHRDVKSTNILLVSAKVSDFGLSKLGASISETHISTAVKGTFGYIDPQYFKTQQLTDKSDVYSFGVVLLEVLCARPVIDQSLSGDEINLAEWALTRLRRGKLEKIIDQRLVGEINEDSLRKFAEIAENCLEENEMDRPAIGDVLWDLEYCLHLQEMEVRRETFEDIYSRISEAHFSAVPPVKRMPSSVVSTQACSNACLLSDNLSG